MIDTLILRHKILDVAIRGGLVPQREEEGDAEVLLSELQENIKDLASKGLVKREKPLPDLNDADIAFEIPEHWRWVRLGQICLQITDGTHKTPKYQEEGVPFLSVKNISSGVMDFSDIKYISEEEHAELIKRCHPEIDDVLVCRIGTLGKALRIDTDIEFSVFVSLGLIKTGNRVLSNYIVSVLNSGYGADWIQANKAGGAMHTYKINLNDLKMMPIPLPPISEQERISNRLDEIIGLTFEIDGFQAACASDLEVLKKKVIEAGLGGKLTQQANGNSAAAESLYRQLIEGKNKMIKDGLIKSDKPLPKINTSEVPFDIPGSWKWAYMGEIFQHNTGKALNSSDTAGVLLDYITTSNMYWDHFELDNLKQMPFTESEIDKCTIRKGDLLVCEGGDIGRSAIWPYDQEMRIQNHIHRLRSYCEDVSVKFYFYTLWFYKQSGLISGRGIGLQGFSSKRLHSLIVPLPPANEQEEIVDMIEEFLAILP